MKTITIILLALLPMSRSEEARKLRARRGSFVTTFPINSNRLQIGGVDVHSYELGHVLPYQTITQPEINYSIDLTIPIASIGNDVPAVPYANSNAIDKPVDEPQEYVPPQSMGSAIIPYYPPPATPVNAVAANVPARMGAVFLGSGSLGVLDLGGGAYAIGSGSIGYSERRSNPRASAMHPILPPVQAAPDLIPAAVNSPEIPQLLPPSNFDYPTGVPLPTDQNGYEYLPPNRVGFGGDPLPPRPIKVTQAFATPSALQVQPQPPLPVITTQAQTLPPPLFQTVRSQRMRLPSLYNSHRFNT